MTTVTQATCLTCNTRLDLSKSEGECYVCDKKIEHHEARLWFPAHNAQTHMACGLAERTFFQPVHDDAGPEACYWTHREAEEVIATYAEEEDFKGGTWTIRERLMTPASYFQAPEFDGF